MQTWFRNVGVKNRTLFSPGVRSFYCCALCLPLVRWFWSLTQYSFSVDPLQDESNESTLLCQMRATRNIGPAERLQIFCFMQTASFQFIDVALYMCLFAFDTEWCACCVLFPSPVVPAQERITPNNSPVLSTWNLIVSYQVGSHFAFGCVGHALGEVHLVWSRWSQPFEGRDGQMRRLRRWHGHYWSRIRHILALDTTADSNRHRFSVSWNIHSKLFGHVWIPQFKFVWHLGVVKFDETRLNWDS